jgi:hypothetical protein
MKIRFLNSCMSAEGMFTAGREYVLSDALAAGFIAAGHAVKSIEEATVPESVEVADVTSSAEEAVIDQAVETATRTRTRKPRK